MSIYEPTTVESSASTKDTLLLDRELTVADTGAGLLVFAEVTDGVGRELVGFADVSDWDAVRGALTKRGLDVGATYHLPVVDAEDVPQTLAEVA